MNKKKKDTQLTTEEKFLQETDFKRLKEIIELFNLDIQKKNVLRVSRLSEVQDKITEQIAARVTNKADEFSNADLLNYFKVMQDTIQKSPVTSELPQIQINQQNITVEGSEGLNRQSRENIANAVRAILKRAQQQDVVEQSSDIIDVEPIIVEEQTEEEV